MAEHELNRSIHTTDFRSKVCGLVPKTGADAPSHSMMYYHHGIEAFGNLSIVSQNMINLIRIISSILSNIII